MLQSVGSQQVRYDLGTKQQHQIYKHCAVHLKLVQNYKSTLLPFFFFKKKLKRKGRSPDSL